MYELTTRTIREIALDCPSTTRVFERHRIDYCCHGNTLFDDACKKAGISPDKLGREIQEARHNSRGQTRSPAKESLSDLVEYIEAKHHAYTRQELEQLTDLIEKVARKHGSHFPY